jgi:hypothetical protein
MKPAAWNPCRWPNAINPTGRFFGDQTAEQRRRRVMLVKPKPGDEAQTHSRSRLVSADKNHCIRCCMRHQRMELQDDGSCKIQLDPVCVCRCPISNLQGGAGLENKAISLAPTQKPIRKRSAQTRNQEPK